MQTFIDFINVHSLNLPGNFTHTHSKKKKNRKKKDFRRQDKYIETNPFHKNTAGNSVLEIFLSKQDNGNTKN